jgi:hypothetical protein
LVVRLRPHEHVHRRAPLLHRLHGELPQRLQRMHLLQRPVQRPPRLLQHWLHELRGLFDGQATLPARTLLAAVHSVGQLLVLRRQGPGYLQPRRLVHHRAVQLLDFELLNFPMRTGVRT